MTINLTEIKARIEAATAGPWTWDGRNRIETPAIEVTEADWGGIGLHGYSLVCTQDSGAWRDQDAALVAHARADLPALVAEVERLHAVKDAVLALHKRVAANGGEWCSVCVDAVVDYEMFAHYPCPTVAALDGV